MYILKNLAVTGGLQALNNCEVTSFLAKGLSVILPEVAQCGRVVAKSLDRPSKIHPPPPHPPSPTPPHPAFYFLIV